MLLLDRNGFNLKAFLELGGDAIFVPHANFGAGSYPSSSSRTARRSPVYSELFETFGLDCTAALGRRISLTARASAINATTLGDGDAQEVSSTSGYPDFIGLEEANIGLRYRFRDTSKDALLLLLGRQRFIVDDGFLLAKGTYNGGDRAAWMYAPRFAFSGPGVLTLQTAPVRADFFVLQNNSNQVLARGDDRPETKFAGFDTTWFINGPSGDGRSVYKARAAYMTLTYFYIYDADTSLTFNNSVRGDRKGMQVGSMAFGAIFSQIPHVRRWPEWIRGLEIHGHYVIEYNNEVANGYSGTSAWATYAEPAYTFFSHTWKPRISYRFVEYSGGKNPSGGEKHSYDTMFQIDGTRMFYGGYWPGEISGNYLARLSDLRVHQIDLTVTPPIHLASTQDTVKLGLHYYNLSIPHPRGLYLSQNDHRFSNELDFSMEWNVTPATSISFATGAALSSRAARAFARSGQIGRPLNIGDWSGIVEMYFSQSL
ncbi:alginate export family protein [Komagataeibacter kakiaceti]|uniref:hypothetical protein n=1 Tax=Komagataeibacter kakiaceti TaxID=943261 RepID=UPI0011DD4C82|nr:hypothetical protein [Komagataeibacter kakiaceti]